MPELDLSRIADAQRYLEQRKQLLHREVERAREQGATWAQIAEVMGTTRQNACQRFGGSL